MVFYLVVSILEKKEKYLMFCVPRPLLSSSGNWRESVTATDFYFADCKIRELMVTWSPYCSNIQHIVDINVCVSRFIMNKSFLYQIVVHIWNHIKTLFKILVSFVLCTQRLKPFELTSFKNRNIVIILNIIYKKLEFYLCY